MGEEDFEWHSPKLVYELEAVVGEQMAMELVKVEGLLDAWAAMAGKEGSTTKKALQMCEEEKSALKFIGMISQGPEGYLGVSLSQL